MRHILSVPSACVMLAAVAGPVAGAQSVAEVVDGMYDSYQRQAEGIDDYTLVQEMMGFETTSYFEKESVDGRPVFRMHRVGSEGFHFSLGDDDVGAGDVFLYGPELVEHGRYGGREDVDGRSAHVIVVDDVSQLDIAEPDAPEDVRFVPRTARIFVDAELMVPLRMRFVGDATTDRGVSEVTMQIDMQDYRDVQGLLVPYVTVMSIEGLESMIDPEVMQQLEEMERQIQSMPPEQRKMMEEMMGAQIERIRQMVDGGGGPMTYEVTVTDVRVNGGSPGR